MNKRGARRRRARKTRARIKDLQVCRLSVHRTPRHVYAQIFGKDGAAVLVSASTLEKELRARIKFGGNRQAAEEVGKEIAERAQKAGITKVAFDRSGFKYHGRIQALAEAARAGGMEF